MAASWATPAQPGTPTCQYGIDPEALDYTATGITQNYGVPYGETFYWHSHTVIGGLIPSTLYYYRCGDAAANAWTVVNSFETAPPAGAEFPFNVSVLGDMGIWNSQTTFADLARVTPDVNFIWHVGDVSYSDDSFLHNPLVFGYEDTWNTYMRNMSRFTSSLPYMVLPGNHEAECHSPVCFLDANKRQAVSNFTAYNHRFRMPSPESGGTLNMWYSFNYGSVHFTNIDTETDYPGAPNDDYANKNGGFGDQLAWLQADLEAASAARAAGKVSWIIVGGHRPVYSRVSTDAAGHPTGSYQTLQAAIEEMLHAYGVDLYYCGHVHSTEVQWPVFNGTNVVKSYNNPPYTTHIVGGAAGCDEGLTTYSNSTVMPPWNRYTNGNDFASGVLAFQDANTMTWSLRRSLDGAILDSFTLTRSHSARSAGRGE